jgi:3-oxoacyl-[acyl-carrier-protein] synthase II
MSVVVITGAGVVTPVAQSPAELHDALCLGANAMTKLDVFASAGIPCEMGTRVDVTRLRSELEDRPVAAIDRIGQLTIVAARRALTSAGAFEGSCTVGLVLGTMLSGAHTIGEFDRRAQSEGPQFASPLDFASTVLNAAAGQAAIRLSLRGVNVTISSGHASGLQALAYGSDLVATGRAGPLLAGGAEELSLETFVGFGRAGLMCGTNGRPGHVPVPFDVRRTGCSLGEGAAFLLLESQCSAQRRGASIHAIVAGHASATDPDAVERGFCHRQVIADVIRRALRSAGVGTGEVDVVSAAANGSYESDGEEAAALAEVFGERTVPLAVTAIKSVLGETLGASGPLQVIAVLEAMRDGRLPGIRGLRDPDAATASMKVSTKTQSVCVRTALVTAVSPEGSCCALVLRRPEEIQ